MIVQLQATIFSSHGSRIKVDVPVLDIQQKKRAGMQRRRLFRGDKAVRLTALLRIPAIGNSSAADATTRDSRGSLPSQLTAKPPSLPFSQSLHAVSLGCKSIHPSCPSDPLLRNSPSSWLVVSSARRNIVRLPPLPPGGPSRSPRRV